MKKILGPPAEVKVGGLAARGNGGLNFDRQERKSNRQDATSTEYSVSYLLLKASKPSKPSKPSTHRWAEIRKRLPSAQEGPLQQKNVCSTHSLYHPTTYISVNYLHGSRDFVDKATRASQVPREFANPSLPPLPPFACRLKGFGMLVGCSCFVGPAGNAAWAIHSPCLPSWISSCPSVLTSSSPVLSC